MHLVQYNTDSYELQGEIIVALLQTLDIAPQALNIPDINSYIGLMQTLFTLGDIYRFDRQRSRRRGLPEGQQGQR